MASLRKAIDSKCRECVYDASGPGGWRNQVEACTAFSCPLFDVRPLTLTQPRNKSRNALRNRELGQNGQISDLGRGGV